MNRVRRPRGSTSGLPVLFAKVRESSKAKVDVTADALHLSAAQIIDAVIDRADIDRYGVIGVPLELVRRARGDEDDLPTLFGKVQVDNKKKVQKTAKTMKISQAVLVDAILQQVPVNSDGIIAWAHQLITPQPDDLLAEIARVQETKLVS